MNPPTNTPTNANTALPFDAVDIARRFGTPTWVYDANTLNQRIADVTRKNITVRYAQKANNNLALLTIMRSRGVLVDAVTAGEARRALAVGYTPDQIVFTADLFDDDALDVLREHRCPVNIGSSDMIASARRRRTRRHPRHPPPQPRLRPRPLPESQHRRHRIQARHLANTNPRLPRAGQAARRAHPRPAHAHRIGRRLHAPRPGL